MCDRFYEGSLFAPSNLWAALTKLIMDRVNWLQMFFSSLIRFWLVLNPNFLFNSSVSFDSYTSNTLSSLGDIAPGDNEQTKLSKSLLDSSSKKTQLFPGAIIWILLIYSIRNKIIALCKQCDWIKIIFSIDHDICEKIDFSVKKETDKETHRLYCFCNHSS